MEKAIRPTLTAWLVALGTALALSAPAQAATTIGSNLKNDPVAGPCGALMQVDQVCAFAQTKIDPGSVAGGGLTAPSDGVIVRWNAKVGPSGPGDQVDMRLRVMRGNMGVGTSDAVPVVGALHTYTNATHLSVFAGDRIAIQAHVVTTYGGGLFIGHYEPGDTNDAWLPSSNPPPADGSSATPTSQSDYEFTFNAEIEPDADHDGFGDETQDQCSSDPSTHGACATKDTTTPNLASASLSNSTFAIDKGGEIARKRSNASRGTLIRFDLSEAATVTATISRKYKGRRKKGKCKARLGKGKRCTILKAAGSFSFAGSAGRNQKPFSGRLKPGSLKSGSYRMTLTATDQAGNKSKPATLSFKIVK